MICVGRIALDSQQSRTFEERCGMLNPAVLLKELGRHRHYAVKKEKR